MLGGSRLCVDKSLSGLNTKVRPSHHTHYIELKALITFETMFNLCLIDIKLEFVLFVDILVLFHVKYVFRFNISKNCKCY